MADRNLEELLGTVESPVELLRNPQTGPNVYPGVPAEYTNWRDEQRAWQKTCVLFNQSYHMVDLTWRARTRRSCSRTSASTASRASRSTRPSSSCPCTPDGYVIGDVILFYLGREPVQPRRPRARCSTGSRYHAETGDYDVKVERDERTALRTDGTPQDLPLPDPGPERDEGHREGAGQHAAGAQVLQHDAPSRSPARRSRALRHGMAGQPGFELFGPWEDGEAVRDALVEAGEEFGLRLVGGRAYSSNTLESGWIPSPLPAVYTGDEHEGLSRVAAGRRATRPRPRSAAASSPTNIEDYYLTPWDLGYGRFVKFDHDFIGREALEKMAEEPHRKKVTLALEQRGRRCGSSARSSQQGRPRQVHGVPVGGLLDAPVRQGHGGRQDGRHLDLGRLQLERGQDADAGDPRRRARRARHRSDLRLGRGERRHRASRPSSRTCRWRCAPSSARCPYVGVGAQRTTRRAAGARRTPEPARAIRLPPVAPLTVALLGLGEAGRRSPGTSSPPASPCAASTRRSAATSPASSRGRARRGARRRARPQPQRGGRRGGPRRPRPRALRPGGLRRPEHRQRRS